MSDEEPIAWIESVPEGAAEGELAAAFDAARDPSTGRVDHILRVHALHPETLSDHLNLYRTIMHRPSGLSRAEREVMAVVVSSLNGCHY